MSSRSSNFEILRIISMLCIVYHHFAIKTDWKIPDEQKTSFRTASIHIIGSAGKIGVNIFMMLTGYFLAGRPAKVKSIARSWFQVIQYSWALYFIFSYYRKMNRDDFLASIFPVTCYGYWFVTCYMMTVLLSPALGKMTSNLSHNEFLGMLSVMFCTMSLSQYFYKYAFSNGYWLVFQFLIGSYFKNFESYFSKVDTRRYLTLLLSSILLNVSSIIYFTMYRSKWVDGHGGPPFLSGPDFAPLGLFISIFALLFMSKIKVSSPRINKLASCTFGVYLIHDNNYMRQFIWRRCVQAKLYYDQPYFYFIMIFVPLGVFVVCSIIELIRQKLFESLERYVVDAVAKVVNFVGNVINQQISNPDDSKCDVLIGNDAC